MNDYVPPKVWTPGKENGGQFASINRPIAGARRTSKRAAGRQASAAALFAGDAQRARRSRSCWRSCWGGPSGAEYDAWLINIGDGDQFGSGFVAANPNSQDPGADGSRSGPAPRRVFESGAILLYLAEKFGAFLPTDPRGADRDAELAVLADGLGALRRRRLRPFLRLCADQDRIRDRPLRDGNKAPARRAGPAPGREPLHGAATTTPSPTWRSGPGTGGWRRAASTTTRRSSWTARSYTHVARWTQEIAARPAVKRGVMVNKTSAGAVRAAA